MRSVLILILWLLSTAAYAIPNPTMVADIVTLPIMPSVDTPLPMTIQINPHGITSIDPDPINRLEGEIDRLQSEVDILKIRIEMLENKENSL
jgi:hypothetical protein